MSRGVVAAGDPRVAEAGASMLRAGGNAVDAVCAAAFTSMVVEGPLTSPAGGGALVSGSPERGFEVLDFFAVVPGLGLEELPPLDFSEVTVSFGPTAQRFYVGRAAAAVPGALFGLFEAHRLHGDLPLSEVVAPAVALARGGWAFSVTIASICEILSPILLHTPGTRALYGAVEALPPQGTSITNRPLADLFEALAREGEPWLRGPFTDALLAGFGPDQGGLLTRADLDAYRPVRRRPLAVPFAGYEVLTNPPPASGGSLIALGLRVAERVGVGRSFFQSPEHLGRIASVLGAVSAARSAGFDARIGEVQDASELLTDAEVARWADWALVHREERALGHTTHISVLDDRGGAAGLTMSNGEGCGLAVAGLGVHMNNFLGEEDINPLGFHRQPAGTRMTTMMSPTVVLEAGLPRLVLGSGGSNRIRSAILQALVNALAFRRPLDEAVNAPRMHVEGRHLWYEGFGLPPETLEALARQWPEHAFFPEPSMFFGGVHAAAREGDAFVGAGDRRRGGTTASA